MSHEPGLLPKVMSGSMAPLQSWFVLKSVVPVTTKGSEQGLLSVGPAWHLLQHTGMMPYTLPGQNTRAS